MLDLSLNPWIFLIEIVLILVGFGLAIMMLADVLKQRRAPASTAAWLLVLLLLPYLGLLLYLLFGARKLPRPKHRMARFAPSKMDVEADRKLPQLAHLLQSLGQAAPLPAYRVHIHETPTQAKLALSEMLARAKRRVLVDMYLLTCDATTADVFAALKACAQRGVEVKVLIDDIGSLGLRHGAILALRRHGADVRRFRPITKLLSLRIANLRNHRKIIVVDGEEVWTGGRNIADCYLADLKLPSTWQDLSCSIAGLAAQVYDDIARSDWKFSTGETLPILKVNRPHAEPSEAMVQAVMTGPDFRDDAWHSALLAMCYTAQRRLWLVTPYFVPDEALHSALIVAARRGIEVNLLVPKRSDNWLVDRVRTPYLRELSHCGAVVMFYQPRMLHTKALLMDDSVAALGSINLDARSLFLNYEAMTVFYSAQEVSDIAGYLRGLFAESKTGLKPSTWWKETLSAPLKILAPLL